MCRSMELVTESLITLLHASLLFISIPLSLIASDHPVLSELCTMSSIQDFTFGTG